MRHLLKIALLTVLAFLGGVLAFVGVHLWSATHRTVSTIFETMSKGEGDALMCGNIDWVDKPFLLHRTAAAVTLLFGVSVASWAVLVMLRKDKSGFAT